MIYTSYYGKMSKFPDNMIPISISQGVPKWYKGNVFKELAPSWDILMEYKNSTGSESEKEQRYNERYVKEILNKSTPLKTITRLENFLPESIKKEFLSSYVPIWGRSNIHIVLLCYEKEENFCHRQLVSEWFNHANIPCKELTDKELEACKEEDIENEL